MSGPARPAVRGLLARPGLGGLSRAGLAVCGLAAAVGAAAPLAGDVVRGPARAGGGAVTLGVDGEVPIFGAVLAVLLAAAAALARPLWAHLAALGLGAIVAYGGAGEVVRNRLSERFVADADVELRGGGVQLALAAALAATGLVIALAGVRRSPAVAEPGAGAADTSRLAVASLVVAILGVFVLVLPPVAVALGTLALVETSGRPGEEASRGPRPRGRGLALAGTAIGLVVLTLYLAGLGVTMLSGSPPS